MAYDSRGLVAYGAAGLLIAALIILTVQFTPIPEAPVTETPLTEAPVIEPVVEDEGLLVIKVKDAPAGLEQLFLQIDGVRVHRAGKGGGWMDVTVVEREPFDLLLLEDRSTVLAADKLPVGNYTEVRLHVAGANATIDGEADIPLRITSDWLKVKIHFKLEPSVTSVLVDIDVNETPIVKARILKPVIKATVEKAESTVEGTGVSMPVQSHYRWADNAEPLTWKSLQDEPVADVSSVGGVLRLRLSVRNEGAATWSGVQLNLQYASDLEGEWFDVDGQGGAGIWRYHDGSGEDGATVEGLLIDGSTVREHFAESSPTEMIVDVPVDGQGEWDICIESNGADAGETYYFRFALSDGTPLGEYLAYPTLTAEVGL
jgi:hypothetical protein